MSVREIKSVAVFCGSNFGASKEYSEGARGLGEAMGKAGITLVYGGTKKGLMGIIADAALEAGGKVQGVITERLHLKGHTHDNLTGLEISPTLRQRKQRMAELADAFIALPGGIGTLEEFMEVWTMNQLGEVDKSVGLFNTLGFFDPLLSFIDHMVASKFLPEAHRHSVVVDADADDLIDKLRNYQRVDVPKWL